MLLYRGRIRWVFRTTSGLLKECEDDLAFHMISRARFPVQTTGYCVETNIWGNYGLGGCIPCRVKHKTGGVRIEMSD
jgi:hypothetical protein